MHQGDTDSSKGLYHINAVDTVTQWEVVGCCQTISEAHLKPVLEALLHQFPFLVRGFHSDNGSEFLNYRVARLLEKMRVEEFTKSRAHRSTDNALVEGKNGAVVRKHIGHEPIAAEHAEKLQCFYAADFNPYLNYHRPCGFATVETASNGKRRRRYRLADYRTPCEKLLVARRAGELFEAGDHGDVSGATSGADERYRVCFADAAPQERTARRVPLATLSEGWESRARSRTGRSGIRQGGRGQGKLVLLESPDQACAQLPPPPNPPPHPKHRHHHRKDFLAPPVRLFQLEPFFRLILGLENAMSSGRKNAEMSGFLE